MLVYSFYKNPNKITNFESIESGRWDRTSILHPAHLNFQGTGSTIVPSGNLTIPSELLVKLVVFPSAVLITIFRWG